MFLLVRAGLFDYLVGWHPPGEDRQNSLNLLERQGRGLSGLLVGYWWVTGDLARVPV